MHVIQKHDKSKGYKAIGKDLEIPVSTVHYIIKEVSQLQNCQTLPGRGAK